MRGNFSTFFASEGGGGEDPRVQILQGNVATLNAELTRTREELSMAWQQLHQAAHGQTDHSATLASLANMRETSAQTQRELDMVRNELRATHQKLAAAETKLSERDEQLSSTRQRLFQERQRVSQLKAELQHRDDANNALQARHRDDRSRQQATEKELLRTQFALGRVSQAQQWREEGALSRTQDNFEAWSSTTAIPASGSRTARPTRSSSIPYGATSASRRTAEDLSTISVVGKVNQHDELAGSVPFGGAYPSSSSAMAPGEDFSATSRSAPQSPSRFGSRGGCGGGGSHASDALAADESAQPQPLARTTHHVWSRSPRVDWAPSAVVSRTPRAAPECSERTTMNFRRLLVNQQGPLYEDEHVVVEFLMMPRGTDRSRAGKCAFTMAVLNRGTQILHHVSLCAVDQSTSSSATATSKLQLEKVIGGGRSSTSSSKDNGSPTKKAADVPDPPLPPQQRVHVNGAFEAHAPFDAPPIVELTYLFQDNLSCKAVFRLPITVARFMVPLQVNPPSFYQQWYSPELAKAEVAFVCPIRAAFLEAGGLFILGRGLELGGALCSLQGVDASAQSFVVSGSLPPQASQHAKSVPCAFIRVELGSSTENRSSCRVAVRSDSYMLNLGLANAVVDLLCNSAPAPAAAA